MAIDTISPNVPGLDQSMIGDLGVYVRSSNKFSAAARRARNQTGRGRCGVIMDSLGNGAGSGTLTGAAINPPAALRAKSMPQQLAALLKASGIPTRCDAWAGSGNISSYPGGLADVASFYAGSGGGGVSFGAGWASAANPYVYGGQMFTSPLNTTAMVFTPGEAADGFDIYYHNAGAGGTFTVSDASGVLATVPFTAAGTIGKASVTRPTASKLPISIAWASGSALLGPISIEPYNSAAPALEFINLSGSGLTAQNWAGTGNNRVPLIGLPQMAFDGVIVGLGANDANQGRTATQFQTDLDALVSAIRAGGNGADVILAKAAKPQAASPYDIVAFLTAIDTVATNRGALGVIDFYNGLALALADYFAAGEIHLSAQGYSKEAALALTALLALV